MTNSFDDFAQRHGLSDADVAKAIGRDRSLVSRMRRGKSIPTLETAALIQDRFGFSMRAWLPELLTAEPSVRDAA